MVSHCSSRGNLNKVLTGTVSSFPSVSSKQPPSAILLVEKINLCKL